MSLFGVVLVGLFHELLADPQFPFQASVVFLVQGRVHAFSRCINVDAWLAEGRAFLVPASCSKKGLVGGNPSDR